MANAGQFKVGWDGGPGRPPALPSEVKIIRKNNQVELIKKMVQLLSMSDEQGERILDGPDCTQLESIVQGLIKRAKEGDPACFKCIVEVTCGKLPEAIEEIEYTQEDIKLLGQIKAIREEREAKQLESKPLG